MRSHGWSGNTPATDEEAIDRILDAIRLVLRGQVYLSEPMTQRTLNRLAGGKSPNGSRLGQLTDRELEVYRLLGEGMTSRDIARRLHLSIKTVETYCARIKVRLVLDRHCDLIRDAIFWVYNLPSSDSPEPSPGI